jgi:predicted DNA binding CopG/RHH family protein
MEKNNKEKKKVYRSMKEFEMEIFPKSYAERLAKEMSEDPRDFGIRLAEELLEDIRQRLSK